MLIRASDNQPVTLGKQIANSGEGTVSETNLSGYLAKIYHNPTLERIEKLKVMLANPPVDPMVSQNHISIAFPIDLLQDQSGAVVGFLMPAIRDSRELHTVYHPSLRKKKAPGFNWYYLHITALNTAWIIQAVHEKGYVLGDIKPQNTLVNDRALVAVIDTDSFQVRDAQTGKVYPCHVGSEGFTPVELLGKDFSTTSQTEIHDRFRLGVLIHYLLFGYHPFSGQWLGVGESPEQTELIRQGLWYGGKNNSIRPSQNTISLDVVHPAIKQCLLRCFNDGHAAPHLRPTAQEWRTALKVGLEELVVCQNSDSHYYSQNYGKCCWCERAAKLGVDIFPPLPGSSTGIKTSIGHPVVPPPKTSDLTQLLQFLSQQIQNPRKYWQVLMAFGLGSLAMTTAGVNLLSQKQSLTSSSPIIPPYSSSVPSPNYPVTTLDNCYPSSSNSNGCQDAVKDMKKAEQAEMELLQQEQERQSALAAKEIQTAAEAEQEQREQQMAEAEQTRREVEKQKREREGDLRIERARQAASRANEAAAIEQSRLEAGRQKRERLAALRLEQTIQASIRAKAEAQTQQARLEARRQKRERLAALRLEQSRQAGIRSERRRQIATKTLDKISLPQKHKHQERPVNQDSNSVNSAKPWESKVPIKRSSDDLENVIKGENP